MTIKDFSHLNCTIYKLEKMCFCSIYYEYNVVLPKTKIPFPLTFVYPPTVIPIDNDSDLATTSSISIGWPTTTYIEVKGTCVGATLLVIGYL